jgi:hypothetical protein
MYRESANTIVIYYPTEFSKPKFTTKYKDNCLVLQKLEGTKILYESRSLLSGFCQNVSTKKTKASNTYLRSNHTN